MSEPRKRYPKPADFKPVKTWPKESKFYGTKTPRCQAWNPNQGRQCLAIAYSKNKIFKCGKHGGKSLSGAALPQTKKGIWSDYLPEDIRGRYEGLDRKDLLSLRQDILLIELRVTLLMDRVSKTDQTQSWKQLQTSFIGLTMALKTGDSAEANRYLKSIGEAIETGLDIEQTWDKIIGHLDDRRRMVESERKRMVEEKQMVTIDQIMLFVTALASLLRGMILSEKYNIPEKERRILLSDISIGIDNLLSIDVTN